MTAQRYVDYRASGVTWVGSVPSHWHTTKLKHLATFSGGGTPSRDNDAYWNGEIPWVSPKDMKSERISDAEERITQAGLAGSTAALIPPGRALVVVRSGILKHTIPIAINDVLVTLNQDMKAVAFRERSCLPSFFQRFVQGLNEPLLLAWGKQGATVESIEHDYMAETVLVLPPISEQESIVRFLDRETARIDILIAKQQRLIELLREKRQALITRAVTKGLDLAVPMKDSGVEWLGEVPAHWEVAKLKHIATVRGGVAKGRKLGDVSTVTLPYLRVANVQDGYIDLTEIAEIEVGESEVERYSLRKGDVLMNEGGDNDKLGRGDVWNGEIHPCLHQNHVFAVRPMRVISEWLALLTSAAYAKRFFESRAKQTTNLASISSSNLSELPVLLPPQHEQQELLFRVGASLTKLDTLSAKALSMVELAKEHRSSLISAAVTGKIDVRQAFQPVTSIVEVREVA